MRKCAGGVELPPSLDGKCPECWATAGQPCGRVMKKERDIVRQMDALLARAADLLNIAPNMDYMDLGHEISEFRRAHNVKDALGEPL